MEIPLQIFDETLRDGEQQAGIYCSCETKFELARRIAEIGVQQIDLMPAVDDGEAALARDLARLPFGNILTAATPIGRPFVDLAVHCGLKRIILFYATSDRLLVLRDPALRADEELRGKTVDDLPADAVQRARDGALARILDCLRYAKEAPRGLRVDFAAEDANRADPDFLQQCIAAIGPQVDHFLLCDTVGALQPDAAHRWLRDLTARWGSAVRFGVHFHNDMGLALENTLQAVLAGASLVSGTFGGIGERAGNVAIDHVLNALRFRYDRCVAGIDYDAIGPLMARIGELGLFPAPPYSPEAQRHMSGIHVQSLMQDQQSYCVFPNRAPEIWFGKMSGAANFQYLFERILNRPQTKEVYDRLSTALKRRARREQRCYSAAEVVAMLEAGALDEG